MNFIESFNYLKLLGKMIDCRQINSQILQNTIPEIINNSMNNKFSPLFPSPLHNRNPSNIEYLLCNIQFHKSVNFVFLRSNQIDPILAPQLPKMTKPGLQRSIVILTEGSFDPSASIMSSNKYILNKQMFDSILYNRQSINVWRWNYIGNVSVHENLARLETHYLVGWHAGVRATYPEVFGGLQID